MSRPLSGDFEPTRSCVCYISPRFWAKADIGFRVSLAIMVFHVSLTVTIGQDN